MSSVGAVTIGERVVGPERPAFIIAELSANHGQRLERALELVHAAKAAGADAIKLQTYTPDTMTIACDAPWFRVEGTIWNGRQLHDLYGEAFTPWEWHAPIKALAAELGLGWFSTPFDGSAVDFLAALDAPAYKIASFELVDVPLLKRAAATGKPIILSTGMATLAEIEEAVSTLRGAGCTELVLLKCTSAYPATPAEMDLRTIPHLVKTFGTCWPVGPLNGHRRGGDGSGARRVPDRKAPDDLAIGRRPRQRLLARTLRVPRDG